MPRANTSINLSGAVADGSDIFRSCSNILDKFGGKPSRDNMAVVNGTARIGRSPATNSSFKVHNDDYKGILRGVKLKKMQMMMML